MVDFPRIRQNTEIYLVLVLSLICRIDSIKVKASDSCLNDLFRSDADGNSRISKKEYVTFMKQVSPDGLLKDYETYNDLPLLFQSTFIAISCFCPKEIEGSSCCLGLKPYIPIYKDPESEEAEEYMGSMCSVSQKAVEQVVEKEEFPTPSPSKTTESPTAEPTFLTSDPTQSPSTSEPSPGPSIKASEIPTSFPTTSAPTPGKPSFKPTKLDSSVPTSTPSEFPTLGPSTLAPSHSPSVSESGVPSAVKSAIPTIQASGMPTTAASGFPSGVPTTLSPSFMPSIVASYTPTLAISTTPSIIPTTNKPSGMPSFTQSPTTSQTPTATPTNSSAPTILDVTLISTSYIIIVPNNTEVDSFKFDLVAAMDIVAAESAEQLARDDNQESRRKLRQRRRLEVWVRLPTIIKGFETLKDDECSVTSFKSESDSCEQVNSVVELVLTEDDTDDIAEEFESILKTNIQDGRLREALALGNPESPISIVTGVKLSSEVIVTGISTGAIVGIALAATLVMAGGAFFQRRQSKSESRQQDKYASWVKSKESGDVLGESNMSESDSSEQGYAMPFMQFQAEDEKPLEGQRNPYISKDLEEENDAISYENSSGWSDNMSASIGSVEWDSAGTGEMIPGSPPRYSSSPTISQRIDDLEAAMSSGDWSAVGASAALLAASQEDRGVTERATGPPFIQKKKAFADEGNIDKETAAHVEQMINSGDWEGVIQTAAKMEAISSAGIDVDSDSISHSDSKGSSTASKSAASSGSNPSEKSDDEEVTPKSMTVVPAALARTRESDNGPDLEDEDIRKQVVELVGKVVPEELGNVDEMIAQFKGREHELLETLRTMKERDVALKAKRAAQQQTKLQVSLENEEKIMRKLATIEAAEARAHQNSEQEDQRNSTSQAEDDDEGSL